MGVQYFEKERVFKLDTPHSSYLIGIIDEENFVGHIYYGKKIESHELTYLLRTEEAPFVPSKNNRDRLSFLDSCPMEYPTHGLGDFREDAVSVRTEGGHTALQLSYEKHEICAGKQKLEGLPATFGGEKECTTLQLHCVDRILGLRVILCYTAFEDVDVIARSVRVVNEGAEKIYLTKVMSACLDMDNRDFDLITLHGSWARERHINRRRVSLGMQGVSSLRGESSHQEHPFMALLSHNADDEHGEVYGMSFVYSGNFIAQTTLGQFDTVRAVIGIHPTDFCWKLEPQESFQAPEAVMVYSSEGLGAMSRSFHDLFRRHLIRGEYKDKKRPILINNWEATYFDFNTEKLIAIAKQASELGIEMLVMDDGWFGHRNDDNSSLGDWFVNEQKLPGGLKYLVDEVNRLGMKFGIWLEPEMISPDSDLYRAHPDWAIQVPGREISMGRFQYVLDITRQEVVDYIYESVARILRSANIEYVKWDMNRQITDIGSFALDSEHMGEFSHRYVLGLYQMQERLLQEFPDLLLENCSGGGGRFDAGMLYYSPQIWTSDDMDPIERLSIQEGTALLYPLSTMGAHICACPNHSVGRTTPMETRAHVALAGTFGYELDLTKLTEEEKKKATAFNQEYHKYNDLVREGDYYRLASYRENNMYDCWQVVSPDRSESLVTYVQARFEVMRKSRRLRLEGLDPKATYRLEGTDQVFSGEMLMNAGYLQEMLRGDYGSVLLHFVKKD